MKSYFRTLVLLGLLAVIYACGSLVAQPPPMIPPILRQFQVLNASSEALDCVNKPTNWKVYAAIDGYVVTCSDKNERFRAEIKVGDFAKY